MENKNEGLPEQNPEELRVNRIWEIVGKLDALAGSSVIRGKGLDEDKDMKEKFDKLMEEYDALGGDEVVREGLKRMKKAEGRE